MSLSQSPAMSVGVVLTDIGFKFSLGCPGPDLSTQPLDVLDVMVTRLESVLTTVRRERDRRDSYDHACNDYDPSDQA